MRLLLLIGVLLLASCGTPAQTYPDEVALGERSYRLHTPGAVGPGLPLVVVLHGGFGSARQAQDAYGWDALADREGFVVAYPDGVGRSWNAGDGCCGEAGAEDVDDVGFLRDVAADVRDRVSTGPAVVVGMSNGAMMAYRSVCDDDTFLAVVAVAGTVLGDCDPPAPMSVLHVHGLDDGTVRMDGAPGDGRAVIDGEPVEQVIADFRALDGCPEPLVSVQGEITTTLAECPDGRAVELVTIAGAGHQWPGAPDRPGRERLLGTDPSSTAVDATEVAWAFFRERVPVEG